MFSIIKDIYITVPNIHNVMPEMFNFQVNVILIFV